METVSGHETPIWTLTASVFSDNPGVLEGLHSILVDFLPPTVPDIVVPPIDTSDLEVPMLPALNLGLYSERVQNSLAL